MSEPENAASQDSNTRNKLALIHQARLVLSGAYLTDDKLEDLCKKLEDCDVFDYAAELLLKRMKQMQAAGSKPELEDYQTLAKYIYKDGSLPSDFKFEEALENLRLGEHLDASENCETLGLAGAIFKRWWQHDHQYKHLLLAAFYYRKGYGLWQKYLGNGKALNPQTATNDKGFNAINYAYILELMVVNNMEEIGSLTGPEAYSFTNLIEAQKVREYILRQFVQEPFTAPALLPGKFDHWMLATIAEAYFGLGRYADALTFIQRYLAMGKRQPWEIRGFSQQLFSIAYLQQLRHKRINGLEPPLDTGALEFEGSYDPKGISDCLSALDISGSMSSDIKNDGKTGIALSGGGFRASLFHIGVLAALAENDTLRDIEVISCVSGGSIIGAYYYLKLKLLLEEKSDEEITRQDYIDLVREVEADFLAGVQKNLRMRIFSNLAANFRMLRKNYSRTNRLGELYEEHLYLPLLRKHIHRLREKGDSQSLARADHYDQLLKKNDGRIYMSDLLICPSPGFSPDADNWKRSNKVPKLILNATSVNTGHNWQFTATWMGEPAMDIITDIDVKSRLRRMYYEDAPEEYRKFRLGYAVGASSCVPVMFEPLPMHGLYPGIGLQLIDGGLHDNQGIAAIIDEECRNVHISDASGQLPSSEGSVSGLLALFMRSDNILQERLRELQFQDMKERRATALVNTLLSVHLKNGLQTAAINWTACDDPPRMISYIDPEEIGKPLTPYGVQRETQRRISEIRTDLDAFHDMEAYALMHNGYMQMRYEQERNGIPVPPGVGQNDWKFMTIATALQDPAKSAAINQKLEVSARVPFKVFYLLPKWLRVALVVVLVLLLLWLGISFWKELHGEVHVSIWPIVTALLVIAAGRFWKPAASLLSPKSFLRKMLSLIVTAIVGWIIFNAYIVLFNGLYLSMGRWRKERSDKNSGGKHT